jgi:hypothetical protein
VDLRRLLPVCSIGITSTFSSIRFDPATHHSLFVEFWAAFTGIWLPARLPLFYLLDSTKSRCIVFVQAEALTLRIGPCFPPNINFDPMGFSCAVARSALHEKSPAELCVTKSFRSRKYDVSISQTMKTDPSVFGESNNRTVKAHAAQGG